MCVHLFVCLYKKNYKHSWEIAAVTEVTHLSIQWNLQTTDTLGAGVLSTVERLSLSRRFANKPRPSILRSLIGICY